MTDALVKIYMLHRTTANGSNEMPRLRIARRLAPFGLLLPAILGLAACKPEEVQSAKPATPVRVEEAELVDYDPGRDTVPDRG